MQTPKSVDIDVTNKCNLRCKYCYHFASDGDVNQDLPTEEWLQFFKEMGQYAVLRVCIGGGEPFIRKDIKTLIDGIVRNRMRFNILSNGTLITDELASYIAATGRCDIIQISIDGATANTNDACRGDGVFDQALKGLKCLQRNKIATTVRVTIHRHNVDDLDNIAELLIEDLGLPGFSTNAASYLGLCRSNENEVQLSIDERERAMQTLLKLNQKYNGRISAAAGPLAEAKKWLEMKRAVDHKDKQSTKCGYLSACGGVYSKLAVRADGVMVPCNMMSHIELGRINRDDLQKIWLYHPELHKIRKRRHIALSEFEFCQGCAYIESCTGNCPALAYTLTGKVNHPSPDSCLKRFLENGGMLPDEKLIS